MRILEISKKGRKEIRGVYKNKNYVHWISNNLIESYGNMWTGKTYLTIDEIIERGLEKNTLLLRDQWTDENMSDKERLEISMYPKDVRNFNVKTLQLNDLNIIDDVLGVYKQYKYVIFDELKVDKKNNLKLLERIYKLSEKYKNVLFLWIGQEPIKEKLGEE